jgi:hypothetical protein
MEQPPSPRTRRVRFDAPVQVFDGRKTFPARVVNLSEGGVFLAVEPTIPIGTGLSFWLPVSGDKVLVRGHVRWTRSIEAGPSAPVGSGVEFYDPDHELSTRLQGLLKPA